MDAGLNLYSLHTLIKEEDEYLDTVARLKSLGYGFLQYSGAPFDVERIKKGMDICGLKVNLTHVAMDRIINDTDNLIAEHKEIGCDNIGLGMMPLDIMLSEDKFVETVAKLDAAAARMADSGAKFFYHHHHYEFIKMQSGITIFDYMLENAKHINFTLDTYWLQYAGVNIEKVIGKCKGRCDCIHLKDYAISSDDGKTYKPVFAPVGDGNMDFVSIIDAAKKAGAKYFFVEQDDAWTKPDPFAEVGRSVEYLKKV